MCARRRRSKLAVIRLSVPPNTTEALPRFECLPVGDSIAVGHLIADTIEIRADELLDAVEPHSLKEADRAPDMRCLVDELDGLARSYERLVGESGPADAG
jgi:hypothetical protein